MRKGKLIVLEGGDGSGKATQTALLCERLAAAGQRVRAVTFPNYESDASMPIRMYLAGRFGTKPDDVNAYVASTFYAIDRFASYRMEWEAFYKDGGIIVADRYVTSNMVHQMTKLRTTPEVEAFLEWLDDLEYGKFELPRPDGVCLLDIPLAVTEALLTERKQQKDGQAQAARDIHELDYEYLRRCHAAYDMLEVRYGWQRIHCAEGNRLRTVEDIHAEVYAYAMKILAQ